MTTTSDSQDPEAQGIGRRDLRRVGGLALMAALPFQVVGFLLHPAGERLEHVQQTTYGPAHLLLFVSWVLALLGLPLLYSVQARQAGRIGLVAYVATILAVSYHLYLTLYEAAAIPVAAGLPGAAELVGEGGALAHGAGVLGPLAGALVFAFPLLGLVTLRARVLPRRVGWLQIASVPVLVLLMGGIGVATGGAVGADGTNWFSGMLPIASLYWVLFAGWAEGGRALRDVAGTATAAPVPATPVRSPR